MSESPLMLNKRVNDKIRDLVLTRAKEVLGNRVSEAQRIIEALDMAAGKIDRTHDIPYLAGSSNDGQTVYIDKRLPKELKIGGRLVDPAKFLRVHEKTEHALMEKMSLPYASAHKIAEVYEHSIVSAEGIPPAMYERALAKYIQTAEKEKVKAAPADLYLKPYDLVEKNRIRMHVKLVRQGT